MHFFFFLPPKEAQGKVRQSQGRAAANNFAFIGNPPLDHLRVKVMTPKIIIIICFSNKVANWSIDNRVIKVPKKTFGGVDFSQPNS